MSFESVDRDRNPAEGGSGGPPAKLIGLVLVVVGVGVFVVQNGDDAQINFLWMDVTWPISLVIGISVLAGVLIDRLGSYFWRRAKRRRPTDA